VFGYEPLRKSRCERLEDLWTGDGRPLPVRLKAQELRQALLAFQKIDIDIWLIERHGCLSPAEYRTQQLQSLAQAP